MAWHIIYDPKPIPVRAFDWEFYHDDHDGTPETDHLCGLASSEEAARQAIEDIEHELIRAH